MAAAAPHESLFRWASHSHTVACVHLFDQRMDYVTADWPSKLIRDRLNLTDAQITNVMAYIATHRAEVEADYQDVLQEAHVNRQYWEDRNHERFAQIAALPPKPGQEALREKLRVWKARLGTDS
ncbi:MAG: DUF433 domain-containing protein [Chloroflexota bacterium]|nr:DUF433 domain-containing protein [Chloroflexota bacterium]